ncbi:MAG: pantetheine-phosphate adenylyltransferase [Kiritimatiellia bacterium]|nr:pantetheine-phosphate adenylyltransferase [Lentisphaerota bacterium]
MRSLAIYPGTFDPLTLGHVDLLQRGLCLFDKVILAVSPGRHKEPLFTLDERLDMARRLAHDMPGVEVDSFDGLLVDYARQRRAGAIIRGVRAFSDFEYEFQMALTNRRLAPDIETIFLMPNETYSYISSSLVREVARLGGDTGSFVPDFVQCALRGKWTS